jgi:lipopolysaccharide export LptBFGC system permease protein LptF
VISDAFTARVLGLIVILFVLVIDVSMAIFSRAPGSPLFPFALYASAPSVPFLIGGTWLIVRAKRFDKP